MGQYQIFISNKQPPSQSLNSGFWCGAEQLTLFEEPRLLRLSGGQWKNKYARSKSATCPLIFFGDAPPPTNSHRDESDRFCVQGTGTELPEGYESVSRTLCHTHIFLQAESAKRTVWQSKTYQFISLRFPKQYVFSDIFCSGIWRFLANPSRQSAFGWLIAMAIVITIEQDTLTITNRCIFEYIKYLFIYSL